MDNADVLVAIFSYAWVRNVANAKLNMLYKQVRGTKFTFTKVELLNENGFGTFEAAAN